ncbi:GAF domain-containing protein [Pedobacter agri]|uniref:GAF domain-containing protein n=1 Tax=Pedobacter agri TaxID=454586 RepID=UPI00292EF080|nr:GAF domain-containing protein [Pedobacter agri]
MSQQKNYDAEFCGNLAIHQTNSIQDFGYLLVLDSKTYSILQASENVNEIIGCNVKECISIGFQEYLLPDDFKHFKAEVNKGLRNRLPFQFSLQKGSVTEPVNILAHVKKDFIILEIEKVDKEPEHSFTEVFQGVRSFISTLESTDNLQEVCEASIKEIRRIARFDGIRMYRFDKDWNGTVIAEEITGELDSYLGQTFPASDVPKQARALYLKNPFRLIPNRNYKTVKLFPVINSVTNGFLDLSDCNLRSVANVHLEYMANMNVTASMSIRVIVDGELWGLISCHHVTSKYLSVESRSIFDWLSMEISYRISSIIKHQELLDSTKLLQQRSEIAELIYAEDDIIKGIFEDANQNLLSLFNATGIALSLNGKIKTLGNVPEMDELENLVLWLEGKGTNKVFYSENLGEIYEEAKAYPHIASGLLVIPIDPGKGEFLICLRPEVIQNIKWGGDPNQAINFEKDGLNYHPRNSFKQWLQTIYGQSEDWKKTEIDIAESLRNFLFEFRAKQIYN